MTYRPSPSDLNWTRTDYEGIVRRKGSYPCEGADWATLPPAYACLNRIDFIWSESAPDDSDAAGSISPAPGSSVGGIPTLGDIAACSGGGPCSAPVTDCMADPDFCAGSVHPLTEVSAGSSWLALPGEVGDLGSSVAIPFVVAAAGDGGWLSKWWKENYEEAERTEENPHEEPANGAPVLVRCDGGTKEPEENPEE